MTESSFDAVRDWAFVTSLLPEDWREQAFVQHALWRRRKIVDAAALLRVLLVHVGHGLSLRETAVRCREAGLAEVSDVAILHRLRVSGPWVGYLCAHLAAALRGREPALPLPLAGRRLLAVDATTVREPGPRGRCWRLHYVMDLQRTRCEQCAITTAHGAEQLSRFRFRQGDLVFADRGYSRASDVAHVRRAKAHVVMRFKNDSMSLRHADGEPFDPLVELRQLSPTAIGDYPVQLQWGEELLAGRLCAVRKSPAAIAREQRKIRDRRRRKGTAHGRAETMEMATYFVVFTTASADGATAAQILSWYGWRWQIEITFKRMKGLFNLGHLPKHDPQSVEAWLQLKLLLALLVDTLRRHADALSPWGYPLR